MRRALSKAAEARTRLGDWLAVERDDDIAGNNPRQRAPRGQEPRLRGRRIRRDRLHDRAARHAQLPRDRLRRHLIRQPSPRRTSRGIVGGCPIYQGLFCHASRKQCS